MSILVHGSPTVYKNVTSVPSFRLALNSCTASKMTTQTHFFNWKSFYQTILLGNGLFRSVVFIHLEIQRFPLHPIISIFWGAIVGILKDEMKMLTQNAKKKRKHLNQPTLVISKYHKHTINSILARHNSKVHS